MNPNGVNGITDTVNSGLRLIGAATVLFLGYKFFTRNAIGVAVASRAQGAALRRLNGNGQVSGLSRRRRRRSRR